jgi:hypothetical protein
MKEIQLGLTRTNYFRVDDETKFKDIISKTSTYEGDIDIWSKDIEGQKYFAFGTTSDIFGFKKYVCEEHFEYDLDSFLEALQEVVNPNDAIIIVGNGYERPEYLFGHTTIITKDDIKYSNIWNDAIDNAKLMLGNKEYDPELTC